MCNLGAPLRRHLDCPRSQERLQTEVQVRMVFDADNLDQEFPHFPMKFLFTNLVYEPITVGFDLARQELEVSWTDLSSHLVETKLATFFRGGGGRTALSLIGVI